jgi:hypothetical protein
MGKFQNLSDSDLYIHYPQFILLLYNAGPVTLAAQRKVSIILVRTLLLLPVITILDSELCEKL